MAAKDFAPAWVETCLPNTEQRAWSATALTNVPQWWWAQFAQFLSNEVHDWEVDQSWIAGPPNEWESDWEPIAERDGWTVPTVRFGVEGTRVWIVRPDGWDEWSLEKRLAYAYWCWREIEAKLWKQSKTA